MILNKKKIYMYSVMLYFICLPFGAMNIGRLGSLLKIVAVLPIFFGLSNFKIKKSKVLLFQTLFVIYASLSIIWTVNFDMSLSRAISYIELLILLYSASCFSFESDETEIIKKSMVWGSRFTAIIVLLFGTFVYGRLVLRGVINEDPNYLCAYFSFGTIFALQKIINKSKRIDILTGIFEVLLYLSIIFFTGSRGGLIAISASIAFYFIAILGSKSKKKVVGIVIAFMSVILFCNVIIDYLPTELSARFSINDVVSSGGSGRTELWEQGIDVFSRSTFLRRMVGNGTATTMYIFSYYQYSRVNVVHNMFLEVLLELGVLGLILYAISILKFVKESFRFYDKYTFAVFICMIVMSLSTSIYTFKPYINIMLFAIIMLNSINKENHKNA